MKRNFFVSVVGMLALSLVLVALPSHSSMRQVPAPPASVTETQDEALAPLVRNLQIVTGEGSWLGVETSEVTAEKAKQLRLPAERGVVLGKIMNDSPASKAGLKENDVVTEINGQRVEGASQFRRMIREIPAGRTAQLTLWRDGRSQSVAVTLGSADGGSRSWSSVAPEATPGTFAFQMPELPELPALPEMGIEGGAFTVSPRPRLGIDAEDLSGQLGEYFGAPEGEGILVRDVGAGTVAEKAGLKAGDVIVSLNGDRIRSTGDLRAKLATLQVDKATTVKLGLLRNKNELSLSVELPAPAAKSKHTMHRTNI